MASQFSGVLQLTDLDDFITPSQVTKVLLIVTVRYFLHNDIVIGRDSCIKNENYETIVIISL